MRFLSTEWFESVNAAAADLVVQVETPLELGFDIRDTPAPQCGRYFVSVDHGGVQFVPDDTKSCTNELAMSYSVARSLVTGATTFQQEYLAGSITWTGSHHDLIEIARVFERLQPRVGDLYGDIEFV